MWKSVQLAMLSSSLYIYIIPFFDMIGVNIIERSFYIAFTFLNDETEEDYV